MSNAQEQQPIREIIAPSENNRTGENKFRGKPESVEDIFINSPADLRLGILDYLDVFDLIRCSLVSQSWREFMVNCPQVWASFGVTKAFIKKTNKITVADISETLVSRAGASLKVLTVGILTKGIINILIQNGTHSLRALTVEGIAYCGTFPKLQLDWSQLKVLTLHCGYYPSVFPVDLLQSAPQLERLTLLAVIFKLRPLLIQKPDFQHPLKYVKLDLELDRCPPDFIRDFIQCCQALESLECKTRNMKVLYLEDFIVENNLQTQKFDNNHPLKFYRNMVLERQIHIHFSERYGHLRHFAGGFDRMSPRNWAVFFSSTINMVSINLADSEGLNNTVLEQMAFHYKKLQNLDVSYCAGVTDVGVSHILIGCLQLKALILNGVPVITDSTLNLMAALIENGRSIQELQVPRNEEITRSGLDRLVKMVEAHNIVDGYLNIDCCKQITSATISKVIETLENLNWTVKARLYLP